MRCLHGCALPCCLPFVSFSCVVPAEALETQPTRRPLAHAQELLSGLRGTPTLVLLSGGDEYVPPGVDYSRLGARLVAALGGTPLGARLRVLPGAPHALAGHEADGVAQMVEFCAELVARRAFRSDE